MLVHHTCFSKVVLHTELSDAFLFASWDMQGRRGNHYQQTKRHFFFLVKRFLPAAISQAIFLPAAFHKQFSCMLHFTNKLPACCFSQASPLSAAFHEQASCLLHSTKRM